jgi:hypothetical protein
VLSEAVVTALVAGFSPWTLLIVAGLLGRERPLRYALVFLASAAVTALLVGFLVVLALGSTDLENRQRHHSFSPALDLVLGIAILVLTPILLRHPPHLPRRLQERRNARKERKEHEHEGHGADAEEEREKERREAAGLLAVVLLGVFAGSPSPLYLAALHSITKGQPGSTAGSLEVLLIAALYMILAEVPIILFALAPERTTALLESANAWLGRNGHTIGIIAAIGVGCYFTVSGIVHLV